jgi:thioredoxin 1
MTKFGTLITSDMPVLINFYQNGNDALTTLKEVASLIGGKAKIIKIDINKNELLADALKIKGSLTYVIYKDGAMKWRQSGELNTDTLIQTLQQFI